MLVLRARARKNTNHEHDAQTSRQDAKPQSFKELFSISFTVIPWRALRPFDLAQGMLCGKTFSLALALWEREWVRVDRQRKRKLAAFPHFALYPDLSPMQLDKLLGQALTRVPYLLLLCA